MILLLVYNVLAMDKLVLCVRLMAGANHIVLATPYVLKLGQALIVTHIRHMDVTCTTVVCMMGQELVLATPYTQLIIKL